ncbi:MAG: SipW-dependent-type signal peptide-containing protein, partial [Oscillospiraceae bacterium]|nr:SipW-dependent-type signal peptide-containing protein [Oscillospiraceae bacterium]
MRRIRWTRKKIASLAMVIALFAIAAAGTLAYYNDTVVAHNIITSSAVDITLNDLTEQSGVLVDFPEGGISGVMPSAT